MKPSPAKHGTCICMSNPDAPFTLKDFVLQVLFAGADSGFVQGGSRILPKFRFLINYS